MGSVISGSSLKFAVMRFLQSQAKSIETGTVNRDGAGALSPTYFIADPVENCCGPGILSPVSPCAVGERRAGPACPESKAPGRCAGRNSCHSPIYTCKVTCRQGVGGAFLPTPY